MFLPEGTSAQVESNGVFVAGGEGNTIDITPSISSSSRSFSGHQLRSIMADDTSGSGIVENKGGIIDLCGGQLSETSSDEDEDENERNDKRRSKQSRSIKRIRRSEHNHKRAIQAIDSDEIPSSEGSILVPVFNQDQSSVSICRGELKMVQLTADSSSEITFFDSTLDFDSEGGSGITSTDESLITGILSMNGVFDNEGGIISLGINGTLLNIKGSFLNGKSGHLDFLIDDLDDLGPGYTLYTVEGDASFNGVIDICLTNNILDSDEKRIELIKYESHKGTFKEIKFRCNSRQKKHLIDRLSLERYRPVRMELLDRFHSSLHLDPLSRIGRGLMKWVKSLLGMGEDQKPFQDLHEIPPEELEMLHADYIERLTVLPRSCQPQGDYGGRNFGVLLGGCDSDGGSGGSGVGYGSKNVIAWLCLSFVLLAIIIVAACVLIYEKVPIVRRVIKGAEGARASKIAQIRLQKFERSQSSSSVTSPKSTIIQPTV